MVLTTSLHYSRRCESSAGVHRGWVLKLDFSGLPWGKDWAGCPETVCSMAQASNRGVQKTGGWPAIAAHHRSLTLIPGYSRQVQLHL